jgi:dolichyl-phosphate-mannose--protein O-mannosyl transferase
VYFPKFAEAYLEGKIEFDVHPPLGKFLIALGILLFGHNELGFRVATALFGSVIPVMVAGMIYRLTYRRDFALLSGAFVLADGLFLVESRFGLINVFLVVFGFAAQIFLLSGLERQGWQRTLLLSCSGVMLGAAVSVKWNGLWFCFMFALLGILVWAITLFWPKHLPGLGILAEIRHLRWWQYLVCFGVPPLAVYFVQWLPYLLLNSEYTQLDHARGLAVLPELIKAFVDANQDLLGGQTAGNLIVTEDNPVHPYCSSSLRGLGQIFPGLQGILSGQIWGAGAWSWPVMARPVGYYFKEEDGFWRASHAIGNPILWWLSTTAILLLTVRGMRRFQAVPAYLLIGFAANYLPWFMVSRCAFIYHYMSAAAFSFSALAWIVCGLWQTPRRSFQAVGLTIVTAVAVCHVFFLPIWLALPVTSQGFYARMWLRSAPVPLFCWSSEACEKAPIKIPAIPGFNWI